MKQTRAQRRGPRRREREREREREWEREREREREWEWEWEREREREREWEWEWNSRPPRHSPAGALSKPPTRSRHALRRPDLRLSDERARLSSHGGGAARRGACARRGRLGGRPGHRQHLLDPRKGRAQADEPPRDAPPVEGVQAGRGARRRRLRGAAGGRAAADEGALRRRGDRAGQHPRAPAADPRGAERRAAGGPHRLRRRRSALPGRAPARRGARGHRLRDRHEGLRRALHLLHRPPHARRRALPAGWRDRRRDRAPRRRRRARGDAPRADGELLASARRTGALRIRRTPKPSSPRASPRRAASRSCFTESPARCRRWRGFATPRRIRGT